MGRIRRQAHGPKGQKEVADGCTVCARVRCRSAVARAVGPCVRQAFHTHIQRRRLREYLPSLLLPRDHNKTLTALVGAEPITQAQTAPVQHLQRFLPEADWDAEAVTSRRIAGLREHPLTTPHMDGALVIDETGDRKDGTHTS